MAAATATAPASLNEATIAQLQAAMGAGRLQSTDLVIFYWARIQTLVPVGISFMGTAFTEPVLIKVASGFEAVTHARQAPQFLATLPFNRKGEPTRVGRRDPLPQRIAPSFL